MVRPEAVHRVVDPHEEVLEEDPSVVVAWLLEARIEHVMERMEKQLE